MCRRTRSIGNLKGVDKVHQLTAVDVFTRWAVVWIVHGPVTAEHSNQFLERIRQQWRRLGYPIRAIVADNGPEYAASVQARSAECRKAAGQALDGGDELRGRQR